MKKLRLFAASLLLCATATAMADGYKSVEVRESDGTITLIDLSDELETTFDNEKVFFNDGNIYFEFLNYKVKSFSFGQTTSGISSAEAGSSMPDMSRGRMSFSNLPANSRIMVISAGGSVVSDVRAEGQYTMSLDNIPAGVYIVKVNKMSYKVTVR